MPLSSDKKATTQKEKGSAEEATMFSAVAKFLGNLEEGFLFCEMCGKSHGRWQYTVSDWESDSHL